LVSLNLIEKEKEMLKVAKAFVTPYGKGGKMVAFVDVIFGLTEGGDGVMTVRGFKIFKDDDGKFNVALPSRKDDKDPNKYYPIISIDREKKDGQEFYDHLNDTVVRAYHAKVNGAPGKPTSPKPTMQKSQAASTKSDSLDDADLLF
jgi:hypothetical protein